MSTLIVSGLFYGLFRLGSKPHQDRSVWRRLAFMHHLLDVFYLDEREVAFSMIRAQGAGGQNVNKVASAVHLRFDVKASSLPPEAKAMILAQTDRRLSKHGVIVIKAQRFRSQDKNRVDALERLLACLRRALHEDPPRQATRPTRAAQQRRIQCKTRHGARKRLREKVTVI